MKIKISLSYVLHIYQKNMHRMLQVIKDHICNGEEMLHVYNAPLD